MPSSKPEDFGTNSNGSKSRDYRRFCFQNRRFTEPKITVQRMIEKVAGFMAALEKMPWSEAKGLAKTQFQSLKDGGVNDGTAGMISWDNQRPALNPRV